MTGHDTAPTGGVIWPRMSEFEKPCKRVVGRKTLVIQNTLYLKIVHLLVTEESGLGKINGNDL